MPRMTRAFEIRHGAKFFLRPKRNCNQKSHQRGRTGVEYGPAFRNCWQMSITRRASPVLLQKCSVYCGKVMSVSLQIVNSCE